MTRWMTGMAVFLLVLFHLVGGTRSGEQQADTVGSACRPFCGSERPIDHSLLPGIGEEVSLDAIRKITGLYGLSALRRKIEKDPPSLPFASDGCSHWLQESGGVSLYPACFLHDLKYWAGYPVDNVARLVADAGDHVSRHQGWGQRDVQAAIFMGIRAGQVIYALGMEEGISI